MPNYIMPDPEVHALCEQLYDALAPQGVSNLYLHQHDGDDLTLGLVQGGETEWVKTTVDDLRSDLAEAEANYGMSFYSDTADANNPYGSQDNALLESILLEQQRTNYFLICLMQILCPDQGRIRNFMEGEPTQ